AAVLRAVAATAEAAEAVAASERIQEAAAAEAVSALIAAGLIEEAAAHAAGAAPTAAGPNTDPAAPRARAALDEAPAPIAAAETVTADLAMIGAADEVAAEATQEARARVRAASITRSEAQILRYLPQPVPFSVIADKLGISRSAAKERAARLYQRLGVHSRDE